ncbi:MAG TPA: NADP(H)-dependent aldo-keto reductase [Candidatus Paceibacterota bacterium]|nr:NADP(H)-dependent aldo-keto reductase [Candidatus Paceibacterota bacterium]
MEMRKIPHTDIEVSKICLGSMNWGQQNTEAEAHEQLEYATSHGINFIDTAEMYPIPADPEKQGTTERYIGNWLAKTGKRDELIIASKVASSELIRTRPIEGSRTHYDRKNIFAAIDGTLERLQTDHVDIYQIHWPERYPRVWGQRGIEKLVMQDDAASIEETLEAMAELVKSGKIRSVGISNETPWGVMEYLRLAREKGLPRIVTIQNQYDLTNRTFEIGLSEMCLQEGIGFLPYSPLGGGTLSGKYLGAEQPQDARHTRFPGNRERYNGAHVQAAIRAYVDVAKKHGLDPAQMALAFVNDRAFTTSTIIGATSMEQLKSDIASADLSLPDEVMADIAAVYKTLPDAHA